MTVAIPETPITVTTITALGIPSPYPVGAHHTPDTTFDPPLVL